MNMTGNTILITGGASGIGFELAAQLFRLGNTVIVTGRDRAKLDAAKKKLPQLHTIQSDVSDPAAIRELYEQTTRQFPQLNVLINNAGIMLGINLHNESDPQALTREIDTNLSGTIRMVGQFLPHLKQQAAAAIVNVSSGLAFVPLPITPVYCATKAGVHSYTQSLRFQLKNTRVKVFELAPPLTETPLLDSFEAESMKGSKAMKVEDLVAAAVKGMQQDRYDILPGQSSQLRFMSRFMPGFIGKMLGKSVDRMLVE